MRKILLLSCFVLSACASSPTGEWKKQGSSPNELYQIKFYCLQQSQQPYTKQHFDSFGVFKGDTSEGVKTNHQLYNACMEAHGFFYSYD